MLAHRRIFLALGLCLSIFVLGCGKGNPNIPAKVNGKVTYDGKPVTGGTVTFHTDDKVGTYSFTLTPNGTYSSVDIPAGEMVVTVETESINPNVKQQAYKGGKGKGMAFSPKPSDQQSTAPPVYVKIPAKYAKKDTSPLKASVKPGSQTLDFDLAD